MPKIIFYNTVVKYKDNYLIFFRILHSFKYHMMRYFLENAAFYYLKFTLFYIGRLIFPEEKLAIITYPSRIPLDSGFWTMLLHFFPYISKDTSPSSSPTARRFWRKKSMCECCREFSMTTGNLITGISVADLLLFRNTFSPLVLRKPRTNSFKNLQAGNSVE
jgi:hypothetical protein